MKGNCKQHSNESLTSRAAKTSGLQKISKVPGEGVNSKYMILYFSFLKFSSVQPRALEQAIKTNCVYP
jgi:hypothetical protein